MRGYTGGELIGPVQGGHADCWRLGTQVTLHDVDVWGRYTKQIIRLIKYYSARKTE